MEIRELSIGEVEEALLLIKKVFLETEAKECTYGGVGVFLDSLKVSDFVAASRGEEYVLLGAFAEEDTLVGVLGARENYLLLLFVDRRYSGVGYGRGLLECYMKRLQSGERTYREVLTNASLGAVKFYEKMGFHVSGDEMLVSGVPYRPMTMRFSEND